MLEQVVEHELFSNVFLSSADSYVARCNSHAITMAGNRVVLNVTLIQSTGAESGDTLTLQVEGSYEGQVWKTGSLGSVVYTLLTESPPDNKTISVAIDDIDYAYMRLSADLSDAGGASTVQVLFSASIVCSEQ
ncbi:MAG: hypothetical protein H6807_15240 [Planctomycetes bacterium]|nr:hypothetical protein [Planctomycetota bacterium]